MKTQNGKLQASSGRVQLLTRRSHPKGSADWSVTDVICTLTAPEGHSTKTPCVTKSSTIALGIFSVKQILVQVMARSCFPSALPIHGQICP